MPTRAASELSNPPPGRCPRHGGIACGQKHLDLVDLQRLCRAAPRGPVPKPPHGQTLLGEPVPLAVVDKSLERRPGPIEEEEDAARERVLAQLLAAEGGQGVDALPAVDRFYGDQDPHLRRDLEHLNPPAPGGQQGGPGEKSPSSRGEGVGRRVTPPQGCTRLPGCSRAATGFRGRTGRAEHLQR